MFASMLLLPLLMEYFSLGYSVTDMSNMFGAIIFDKTLKLGCE